MSTASRLAAVVSRLPPAVSRDVLVERDIEAKMGDGTVLLADRWYSPGTAAGAPVVLLRSPYGRRPFGLVARIFAERGYQAVVQSVRGTFGSGGRFDPFRHERDDGRATLEWISEQPWFTGSIATFGPSYLGMTQWAVVEAAPEYLAALAVQMTSTNFRDAVVYPGGSFSLETGAVWVHQVFHQERGGARLAWAIATSRRRLRRAYSALPLRSADVAALGSSVPYYQDWLVHELPDDPWWAPLNFSAGLATAPPTSHVAGWYDLFLPGQVEDYLQQRRAGRDARLTIGPWTHTSFRAGAAGLRDGLDWFDSKVKGQPAQRARPRVRLQVMGERRWVNLADWPPPADPQRWFIQPARRLGREEPGSAGPDRYRFDPSDPTPSVGGPSLDVFTAGPRNQRRREERPDVLVYSTSSLQQSVTVAGHPEVELWVRSSCPYFDVFIRLCDVSPAGRSTNVSDGIVRVDPSSQVPGPSGVTAVRVPMWPTAYTFGAGHRIRLQISSAAHPLFAVNTGCGDRLADAATFVTSDVEIFRDPQHPTAVVLPAASI